MALRIWSAEVLSIPITLIILILAFGSLVAAGIPVLLAFTAVLGAIGLNQLAYYMRRKNLYYFSISRNQQGACPDLQYVDVVYNGEDPRPFPIVERPGDYICFLGRFDHEKNPHPEDGHPAVPDDALPGLPVHER